MMDLSRVGRKRHASIDHIVDLTEREMNQCQSTGYGAHAGSQPVRN